MMATRIKSNSKKCIAFTRSRTPCPENCAANSKWCPAHEELQGKCMRIYKHHSRELDSFAVENTYPGFQVPITDSIRDPMDPQQFLPRITNEMIPRSDDVNKIDDPITLRTWHHVARRTWALANRAVLAREHHHSQFYQDGDDNHRHFNRILRRKQDLLESLMSDIDQRLYRLTIGVEQADWLLSKPSNNSSRTDSESDEDSSCDDSIEYQDIDCQEEPLRLEPPPTPPSSPTPCQECQYIAEDPEDKLARRKKQMTGQLINYLNFPLDDTESSNPTILEIREVIRNVFRRIIVRDAGLFVRAKEFSPTPDISSRLDSRTQFAWHTSYYQCPIKAFINSEKLSLKELERLWGLLKFGRDKIGPELIRNAIADIYRSPDGHDESQSCNHHHKKSAKIWVLGGFVWRKAKDGPLPRRGSDHLHAFVGCAGCMLSTCRTFEEWAENRRLAVIGCRYPGWAEPQELEAERLFRCLRMVACRHNSNAKLSRVEKVVPKSKKLRTVYTETQERHYMYLCMSLADPRSLKIINALHARPSSFNVYAQRRDTKEVTHRPSHKDDLWFSRVRSGYTTMERKVKKFTPTTSFKVDGNLFDGNLTSPEKAFQHEFKDCWDVLLMDAKVGSFDEFLDSIGRVTLEIIGYESIQEALKGEEGEDKIIEGLQSNSESHPRHAFEPSKTFLSSNSQLQADYSRKFSRPSYCRSLFRESICDEEKSMSSSWI